jgi:PA14 domain
MSRNDLRTLWQQSRNFRRLGGVIALLFLLYLLGKSAPVATPPQALPQTPPQTPPPATVQVSKSYQTLAAYPQDNASWGKILNPDNHISGQGFDAYYLNADVADKTVHRENSPYIDLNLRGRTELHGIPADRVAAYWVGYLDIPTDARYKAWFDAGHGSVKVRLNGHLIYNDNYEDLYNPTNKQFLRRVKVNYLYDDIFLPRGRYLLEAEFIAQASGNGKFHLNFAPALPETDVEDGLATILQTLHLPANTVVFAAVTNKLDEQNRVRVRVESGNRPYLLLLDGDEYRNWEIDGDQPPRAVVVKNASNTVHAVGSPPVVYARRMNLAARGIEGISTRHCHCSDTSFTCDDRDDYDFAAFDIDVRRWTGYPLAGVGLTADNRIPQLQVTTKTLQQKQWEKEQKIAQERADCWRRQRQRGVDMNNFDTAIPQVAP